MERFYIWAFGVLTSLLLFLAIAYLAEAQFTDIPDRNTASIGVLATPEARSLSATSITLVPAINGWLGLNVSNVSSNKVLLSQILVGHLQGSLGIIEGFGRLERDIVAGIKMKSQVGAYVRPGSLEIGGAVLSGGFGNFFENTQPQEVSLTADSDELRTFKSENVSRWLAIGTLRYKGLKVISKLTPEFTLQRDFQVSVDAAYDFAVSETFSLGWVARSMITATPGQPTEFRHTNALVAKFQL